MRGKDRLWRGGVDGTRKGSGDVILEGVARAASLRMFQWTVSREVRVTWASVGRTLQNSSCRTRGAGTYKGPEVGICWCAQWTSGIRVWWKEWEGHGGGSTNHQGVWGHWKCGFHFKWKILIKEELWSHLSGSLWLMCWWQVREGQGWKQEDQLGDHRWGDHSLDQGRGRAGAKKCLGLGSVLKPPEFGDNVGYGVCRGKGGQMWFQRFQPQQLET